MNKKNEENELIIWTVYDKPKDFPNNFVARKQIIGEGQSRWTGDIVICNDLKKIQAHMERQFLFRLPRNEDDDPKIVECWM